MALMLSVFMAGCLSRPVHPTKPQSEWAKDHADCERLVRKTLREAPDPSSYGDEMLLIKECMKKKGWHRPSRQ